MPTRDWVNIEHALLNTDFKAFQTLETSWYNG